MKKEGKSGGLGVGKITNGFSFFFFYFFFFFWVEIEDKGKSKQTASDIGSKQQPSLLGGTVERVKDVILQDAQRAGGRELGDHLCIIRIV